MGIMGREVVKLSSCDVVRFNEVVGGVDALGRHDDAKSLGW